MRCHLILAPRAPPASAGGCSPVAGGGSRFSALVSDDSGSDVDDEGIPFEVAQTVLDGESDEGWTPVSRRRMKTKTETVADFWREIGYPTSASRFWEGARRSPPHEGTHFSFCRSDPAAGRVEPSSCLPSASSSRRGACLSPSGVRPAHGPRVGSWRGPLARRRVTPPPVLGDFLGRSPESSRSSSSSGAVTPPLAPAAGGVAESSSTQCARDWEPIQNGAILAPVIDVDHGHAGDPVLHYSLGHLD
jgi:hypothetical protein